MDMEIYQLVMLVHNSVVEQYDVDVDVEEVEIDNEMMNKTPVVLMYDEDSEDDDYEEEEEEGNSSRVDYEMVEDYHYYCYHNYYEGDCTLEEMLMTLALYSFQL